MPLRKKISLAASGSVVLVGFLIFSWAFVTGRLGMQAVPLVTTISNRATVSYQDAAGQTYPGTSNTAVTQIQPTDDDGDGGGGLTDGMLVKGSTPAVYLMDQGKRMPIFSGYIFEQWGFKWDQISLVSDSTLSDYPLGGLLFNLVKSPSSPAVYLVNQGTKKPIINAEVFEAWGFRWSGISVVSDTAVARLPTASRLTRLVKGSSPAVYLIDHDAKHPIVSAAVFNHYGLHWSDISTLYDRMIDGMRYCSRLTQLAKGDSPTIYLIENNQKRPIVNPTIFTLKGFSWSDVSLLSDKFLRWYPEGAPVL